MVAAARVRIAEIALQIAATSPAYILESDIPAEVIVARDTALMFRVSSGFAPLQASLGGLPGPGLVVAGGSVFATDAANGLVYEVDVEDMTTVSSRY